MRVIFLDIDGVLNHTEWRSHLEPVIRMADDEWWIEMLDPQCVSRLNSLIAQTGAQVVISSTWRQNFQPEKMQEILEAAGFEGTVIDNTTTDHLKCRGDQIARWLESRGKEVESFVILDDRGDMNHLVSNLVQTTEDEGGLREEHIEKAIDILT